MKPNHWHKQYFPFGIELAPEYAAPGDCTICMWLAIDRQQEQDLAVAAESQVRAA